MRISFSSQNHINYGSNCNIHTKDKIKNQNNANSSLVKKNDKNSLLENLIEQKSKLMDSKKKLMEKNNDPSSIKDKFKEIDKQIEEINKQINKIQIDEQRKALGTDEKSKNKENSKNTSNKVSNKDENLKQSSEGMDNLLKLSSNMTQAKALSSQKTLMSGEARVLACEIKIDEARGLNPIKKRERLSTIKDNIEKISENLGNSLKNVNNNTQTNISSSSNDEAKQEDTINGNVHTEDIDKSLIKKQQTAQKIKHYTDNMDNKSKDNNEQVNLTA